MKKQIIVAFAIIFLALFSHGATNAYAVELVTNGGFETANFTGWTAVNASGSWMDWQVSPNGAGGGFNPPYVTAPQEGTRSAWNGVTANANQVYSLTQTIAVPAGNIVQMTWKDRFQMNLFDFCTSAVACGSATYRVQILNTSDVVLQTLYTVTAPPLTKTDTGWVTHNVGLTAYQGQTIKIRFSDFGTVTFAGPGQAEIDAVSIQALPTTASYVSVGGQVTNASGMGIAGATVSLTDNNGDIRSVVTSPMGYYNIEEVLTGESYVIGVKKKGYVFPDSPQIINVNDGMTVNFQASP